MKFKIPLLKTAFIFCAFFLLINTSFAFDDLTTHPAITDEIVDFYNLSSENKLNTEQKGLIILGIMQEDTPPRWINHFYDPIRGIGWTGRNTGIWPTSLVRYFSGTVLSSAYPVSSLNWLHNQELQTYYKKYKGNRTWERAIYEYINGNKKEALYTLGFILHLVEDMAVPDHTRDDPHAHEMRWATGDYGSPLEEYGKQYNRNNFIIADKLKKDGYKIIVKDNIDDYLVSLAEYSNNHFFSKDTINDVLYKNPKIVREDGEFGYGKDKNGEEFEIVKIKSSLEKDYVLKKKYLLETDKDIEILSQYFTRLSREAVIYGAGVIDLFFREIEMIESGEKEAPELFVEEDKSVIKKIVTLDPSLGNVSVTGEFFKIVNFTADAYNQTKKAVSDTVSNIVANAVSLLQKDNDIENQRSAVIESQKKKENKTIQNPVQQNEIEIKKEQEQKIAIVKKETENKEIVLDLNPTIEKENNEEKEKTKEKSFKKNFNEDGLIPVNTPFFGGGGGGVKSEEVLDTELFILAPTAPSPPTVTTPASSGLYFATSTITFSGTASSTLVIETDYSNATTTADSNDEWELTLYDLPQGTTTIQFTATNSEGLESDPTEVSLIIDTISPSISSFGILQCDNSLKTDSCLSGSELVNLYWTSTSTDILYYSIIQNGSSVATTTATSSSQTLSSGSTHSVKVVAYDNAGNYASSSLQSIEISTMPIIINEVAWSGTASSSPTDEWIELYNKSSYTIDLSDVFLVADDGAPYINLSGTIAPGSYYLIERNDDDATSVSADLAVSFSFGLSNTVEHLSLVHSLGGQASTTLDSTPSVSSCSGAWCAGTASSDYRSMERISSSVVGIDTTNWASNNTYTKNGTGVGGNAINGTPRLQNSVSLLSIGYYCLPETSSYISGGYYTAMSGSGFCTYLSYSISGNRYGDLYKGTIANSTQTNGQFMATSQEYNQGWDNFTGAVQGDNYFTVIYKTRTGPAYINDVANFRSYFMTGANPPPHLDYGIIEWKYGIAP